MNISKEKLLDFYYYMKLARITDEKLESLYKQGRLPGAIYSGIGQEASEVGCAMALQDGDIIATTHRDMAALLVRGITVKDIMAQHFAKITSPTRGRGEDNYLGNLSKGIFTGVSMLPDLYPVALGAALYFVRKREKKVAMPICGEGATARGDFHETLNWAAISNLPVVFVVINNQFAYSTPNELEIPFKNVSERAKGYGIQGFTVDGNDVLAVYEKAKEAVDGVRGGGKPILIECKTMRMKGHAGHDSADYVPKERLEKWAQKDPVSRFEGYLIKNNYLDEKQKKSIIDKIEDEVNKAIAFAQESPYPDPKDLTVGVYSG